MRLDSCRQCIRRRIRCDAGIPECTKCLKKGLACSGIGKQYRFVNHRVVDRKLAGVLLDPYLHTAENEYSKPGGKAEDVSSALIGRMATTTVKFPTMTPMNFPHAGEISFMAEIGGGNGVFLPHSGPLHHPEAIDYEVRMLFDHFSHVIAPAMVVIDERYNGYRNILLPLATQNPMVQQAVSVVAALHLGKRQSHLLQRGENTRSAIIKRLQYDTLSGNHEKVFSIPTWATLVLLLVGETVTGDCDFVQLFAMLKRLLEYSNNLVKLCPEAGRFLLQQSQMFSLFTPPFLDADHGLAALQGQLDVYFDFLSYPTLGTTTSSNSLALLRKAIYLTRDLYLQETQNMLCPAGRRAIVESIRQLLDSVGENTPGMHAFVWCYFIAGASSVTVEHRGFFLEKLKLVYNKTGMRNILVTMDMLQQLVWQLPEDQNWTRSSSILKRVLIM